MVRNLWAPRNLEFFTVGGRSVNIHVFFKFTEAAEVAIMTFC